MRRWLAAGSLAILGGCLDSPPSALQADAEPPDAGLEPPAHLALIGNLLTYDCDDAEDGRVLFDRSGAGRHASVIGTTRVAGRFGGARQIGSGSVAMARDPDLGPGPDGITIEVFVRLDTGSQIAAIASDARAGGDPPVSFHLEIQDASRLVFQTSDLGGMRQASSGAVTVPVGDWVHVAVTWDRETAVFYLDGEEVGTEDLSAEVAAVTDDRFAHFGAEGSTQIDGALDEIKISSYAKTAEQIAASMAFDSSELVGRCGDRFLEAEEVCDGQALCCSDGCQAEAEDDECIGAGGSCVDGRCEIAAAARVTEGLVALYSFDSSASEMVQDEVAPAADLVITTAGSAVQELDFLRLSGGALLRATAAAKITERCAATNELTLEAWVAPENVTQSGPARIVTHSPGILERNFTLGQDQSRWSARILTEGSDANGLPLIATAAGDVQPGVLTHLVVTVAGGQRRLYQDGRLRTIGFMRGDFAGGGWIPDYPLVVGNEETGNRAWSGDIHLVAIYDRELSELEVAQNYAAGADP